MIVVAFLAGVACGSCLPIVRAIRYLQARSHVDEESGSLRHVVDHLCRPPHSHWNGDWCFLEDTGYHSVLPGDVWVCPDCLQAWHEDDGWWKRTKENVA